MKYDVDVRARARAAMAAAWDSREEMLAEVESLKTVRAGMWSEIRAAVEARIDGIANDLEGYRALDDSLDGLLGIDRFVRRSREQHVDAIRRKEAFEEKAKDQQAYRDGCLKIAEEFERNAESFGTELFEAERRLFSFDPEFLAVKKLIDGLPKGTSRDDLRSPTLFARFFETPLAVASRRLHKYESARGKGFDDVLTNEYQPLVDRISELNTEFSSAMRSAGYAREEYEGLGYRGGDDLGHLLMKHEAELGRSHEEMEIKRDLEVTGQILDDLDAACRNAAVEGIRIMIESFDSRFRAARKPVRMDDLERFVEVGLLGPAELVTVVHRAGVGAVIDRAEVMARHQGNIHSNLERSLDFSKWHDDSLLSDSLDWAENESEKAARSFEAIKEASKRVRTQVGPSVPMGGGLSALQDAVMRWATHATDRVPEVQVPGEAAKDVQDDEDVVAPCRP